MSAYERLIDAARDRGYTVKETGPCKAKLQCGHHNDSNPSVSVTGIETQALIHCHAGCDTADVLAAYGLTMADLFDNRKGADYHYPGGRVVHRKPDKTFRQSVDKPDKSLFHVDRVSDAATVYVVEGEKDVLAVESVGGVAVCSAMGAGKGAKFDWTPLRGKNVIVVADKDEPGRDHAAEVAKLLNGIAASVDIAEAAVGKDAADHIAAGKTLDELVVRVPEFYDGAELLDDVKKFVARFVVYPSPHALVAHVLWIVHTWLMACWESTPRIAFLSPEPGSGKSRALEVTEPLVPTPVHAVNTTPAYLFRKVSDEDGPPTILYDEIDTVFGPKARDNEEIRGMLNAGHRRGAMAGRCAVRGKQVFTEELPAYCAVALAGLDDLPDTIMSRCVVVRMKRRAASEKVEPWRLRVNGPEAKVLQGRIAAWAESVKDRASDMWPDMPPGVEDRAADVWEALLAVADLADGHWPEDARCSAVALVADSMGGGPSLGVLLLQDMRAVFDNLRCDRLETDAALKALNDLVESPWAAITRDGKALNARGLAQRLGKFDIHSRNIRGASGKVLKGYLREDFIDSWARYLPPKQSDTGGNDLDFSGSSCTNSDIVGPPPIESATSATPLRATFAEPLWETVRNGHQAASPEQQAAYVNGMCIDCGKQPPSAGRPRCDTCHRTHTRVMAGYDR